jgi:methyl-accepting chemotaxis protein
MLMVSCFACIIGIIAAILFARSVTRPVNDAVEGIKDIAQGEGDLTRRLETKKGDEIGDMARWFNQFVKKLGGIVGDISAKSDRLGHAADDNGKVVETITEISEQVNLSARDLRAFADDLKEVLATFKI